MTTLRDLEVSWDGLWTFSFGLSQFHGHGSWLVNEVALKNIHQKKRCLEEIRPCVKIADHSRFNSQHDKVGVPPI